MGSECSLMGRFGAGSIDKGLLAACCKGHGPAPSASKTLLVLACHKNWIAYSALPSSIWGWDAVHKPGLQWVEQVRGCEKISIMGKKTLKQAGNNTIQWRNTIQWHAAGGSRGQGRNMHPEGISGTGKCVPSF